jgi:tripeptide aminopeptidase
MTQRRTTPSKPKGKARPRSFNSQVNHRLFRRVLLELLPLRNPSYPKKDMPNLVLQYCQDFLKENGRAFIIDEHDNITSWGAEGTEGKDRAIVAHTDSVGQQLGADYEPITVVDGRIHSVNEKRPIGGDDKVGIAIALTIAATQPDVTLLLFATEESGCVGSQHWCKDLYTKDGEPFFDLAVQCDRKGITDLVYSICGVELASKKCRDWAHYLLPHREVVHGGLTDVMELMDYGLARNAFNMSCGYYYPHTEQEFIVYQQALQTFIDASILINRMPFGLPKADNTKLYKQGRYGRYTNYAEHDYSKWDSNDYASRWSKNNHLPKNADTGKVLDTNHLDDEWIKKLEAENDPFESIPSTSVHSEVVDGDTEFEAANKAALEEWRSVKNTPIGAAAMKAVNDGDCMMKNDSTRHVQTAVVDIFQGKTIDPVKFFMPMTLNGYLVNKGTKELWQCKGMTVTDTASDQVMLKLMNSRNEQVELLFTVETFLLNWRWWVAPDTDPVQAAVKRTEARLQERQDSRDPEHVAYWKRLFTETLSAKEGRCMRPLLRNRNTGRFIELTGLCQGESPERVAVDSNVVHDPNAKAPEQDKPWKWTVIAEKDTFRANWEIVEPSEGEVSGRTSLDVEAGLTEAEDYLDGAAICFDNRDYEDCLEFGQHVIDLLTSLAADCAENEVWCDAWNGINDSIRSLVSSARAELIQGEVSAVEYEIVTVDESTERAPETTAIVPVVN